jgi:signal transduction histidine kinase
MEELRRRQAEADSAAAAKSDFLANITHEIRTPLTAVLGFTALLELVEGLPPKAQDYVRCIATGGQSLLTVANDILDFSKLEAGQLELDPQPFDPSAFIDDTIALVSAHADSKGLALRCSVEGRLPALVEADSDRLRQVLLNLLNNAIKFTDAGAVTLVARYEAELGWLEVRVSDTGAGIPAHEIGRLFERFSQLDGSSGRRHGGTGLGLAICKNLIELMGGDIFASSADGGSTFSFVVPAPVVAETAGQRPTEPTAARLAINPLVDDLDRPR